MSLGTLKDGLRWIHTLGDRVEDAREVAPSVWMGGKVVAATSSSTTEDPAWLKFQIRPILGYCGWAREQLELELERGVWIRCRADSPETARAICMRDADELLGIGGLHRREKTWRAALKAAGCPGLANFPRGPKADVSLQRLVHAHYRSMLKNHQGATQMPTKI
eukprot:TRINITY_DN5331_c2_g1_i2.p1 TRINITY_DN5331_c2_g1~~TRINITY_DN5331_c2_g1_i2.p1  ORF type:complete len:181 (-),score=37.34 TRINITY_DN5331_c2_g1_i2:335-826(-)